MDRLGFEGWADEAWLEVALHDSREGRFAHAAVAR